MQNDDRGLALSTESADAAHALSSAAESFISQKLDTMSHVSAALEADPGCVLAHIIKGLLIVGVRLPSRYPEARAELEAATEHGDANDREWGYIAALSALLDGQVLEAVRIRTPSLLKTFEPRVSELEGRCLNAVRRLGKRIVFEMES